MRREQLSRVFGNLEDRQIAEAFAFDPDRCDHAPERIVPMKKKKIVSFVLAAALILALGATAYAIDRVSLRRYPRNRRKPASIPACPELKPPS